MPRGPPAAGVLGDRNIYIKYTKKQRKRQKVCKNMLFDILVINYETFNC
jgi:hypothetical protein